MNFLIDHDLHCHTSLSSCCMDDRLTTEAMLAHAKQAGYRRIAVTDHLWDTAVPGASDWYAPQTIAHVRQSLPLPQADGIEFLFGCETEYCGGEKLGLARPGFDLFDMVVIPVNHLHMIGFVRPADVKTAGQVADLVCQRLEELLQLDLPWAKIGIAHLSSGIMFREGNVEDVLTLMDSQRLLRIFDTMAKRGVGVELNAGSVAGWESNPDVRLKVYRLAKQAGCRFYCASDAHAVESMAKVPVVLPDAATALELTENDMFIPAKGA